MKNSNPKISVIVPVYNVEQYLPQLYKRYPLLYFHIFSVN